MLKMNYLIILILCAISFSITSADDGERSKMQTTTRTTMQKGNPEFPYFTQIAPNIPKIIFLKNLLELNCLKDYLEKNRLKNRSINQKKKEFVPNPTLKNVNKQLPNANRKVINPPMYRKNQSQNKFLLVPSKAGPNFNYYRNKMKVDAPKEHLYENQRKLMEEKRKSEMPKHFFKKEIPKNKEAQKTNPQVFPEVGFEEESVSKQENVKANISRLTNKPVIPQFNSYYKMKPQPIYPYEVEEVFQDDMHLNVNKESEDTWEKIKNLGGKYPKPSLDVNSNIFDMINKLLSLNANSESVPIGKSKMNENGYKVNKKSKLDEKIWQPNNAGKNNDPFGNFSPFKTFTRNENSKGNKDNQYFNEEYVKTEKFRRNEKSKSIQNSRLHPMSKNIDTSMKKNIASPRIQAPALYKSKIRQSFTNVTPTATTQATKSSINLLSPGASNWLKQRNAEVERGNAQFPIINDIPTSIKQEFQPARKNESGITNHTSSVLAKQNSSLPQTTEKIKSSSFSESTSTFVKSVKYYSQTTLRNPEILLNETENPVTLDPLKQTTETPARNDEGLKNSRKMHFGEEKNKLESAIKKQKSEGEQRRSDILIEDEDEDDATKEITATNYIDEIKKNTSLTFDSIPVKTLASVVPMVIDDLRKNRVTPENAQMFAQIYGKYWPVIKGLSNNTDIDILPLVKIKNKQDFQKFFDNLNLRETNLPKENVSSSNYDYMEEYKEMYKDMYLLEKEENLKKLRVRRDEGGTLENLDGTEFFESVREEQREIDYLYEDFYNTNSTEDNSNVDDLMTMIEYFFDLGNSSKNIFSSV